MMTAADVPKAGLTVRTRHRPAPHRDFDPAAGLASRSRAQAAIRHPGPARALHYIWAACGRPSAAMDNRTGGAQSCRAHAGLSWA